MAGLVIPCTATPDDIARRLVRIRERIEAAGGDPDAVTVLAVTKGFDRSAVDLAVTAGLTEMGENYAQELVAKADPPGPFAWHAIGRLQTNKVRLIASHVSLWQSVDRVKLGMEIARRAPGARVLVQVDVSEEPQKGGCPVSEVASLVADLGDRGLSVEGLMAVGPNGPPQAARPGFAVLRRLADELDLAHRSMGMSSDLEVGVEEGSTMVRIGTDLFGPRSTSAGLGN